MITAKQFTTLFPAFTAAPSALVDELLKSSTLQKFMQDSYVYLEGDSCPGIAFILSGEIRVFKISPTGRELTLYELFPGDTCIINASCILSRQKYPANAVGLSEGELLYLEKEVFRQLMARDEVMQTYIFQYFSSRYAEIIELVEALAFHKMDDRLIDYLIAKASANNLQTTHHKIANDLGTSREVVSRLLKEMERQGKVSLRRNNIILLAEIYQEKT